MEQSDATNSRVLGLLDFPTELLREIYLHLLGPKDLSALCQSSKLLSEIGRPYLYHSINAGAKTVPLLARTLVERPDIGKMVHVLHLCVPHGQDLLSLNQKEELSDLFERVLHGYIEPYFVQDLFSAILRQTKSLNVLSIRVFDTFQLRGPIPSLNSLKILDLTYGGPGCFLVNDQIKWLLRGAPNLYRLELDGPFMDGGSKKRDYRAITHLTMSRNQCNDCGDHYLFDMLAACKKLTTFTYQVPGMCLSEQPLKSILSKALKPHQKTLVTLRLEPTEPLCIEMWHHIDSLKQFTNLENLSFATRFMVSKTPPLKITKLFRNLPPSIRTLDILKEHNEVDPLLLRLVKSHQHNGLYPNLELLSLRIPCSFRLRYGSGEVQGLEKACEEADLEFFEEKVCGGPADILEYGCGCWNEFMHDEEFLDDYFDEFYDDDEDYDVEDSEDDI